MLALTFVEDWDPSVREAVIQVQAALEEQPDIQIPDGTVNLKLVDADTSKALNEQYTGNAYATDVLTFNYQEAGQVPEGEIADVAICLPIAREQAQEAGQPLPTEVARLALHGLLHVLGFDHQTPAEQHHLHQIEHQILDRAGFKPGVA